MMLSPPPRFTQKLPNGFTFDLLYVAGGRFEMGSDHEDAYNDEKPVHAVDVPSFYLGEFLGTQALWLAVIGGENPALFQEENRPVEQVNWYDALVFCNALSMQCGYRPTYFADAAHQQVFGHTTDGFVLLGEDEDAEVYLKPDVKGFRLPSEAEWEFAARGGNQSQGYLYAGGNDLDKVGWHNGNSHDETKAVGLKLPNELGFYDMSGNVYEWCEDQWHGNYDGAPTNGPAWVDLKQGTSRVFRGGGWFSNARFCRPTNRGYDPPTRRGRYVGFRVVFFFPPGSWSEPSQ
jgi:formylglycine-generating enzyme required for sulfatase activity